MTQDPSLPPGGAGPPLVPDFAACGTAEGVVVTKLAPMPQQARLIARSAVLDMLDAARQKRIILVNASAGYGKTTLLAQWRERLMGRGITVAWLSLDDDDGGVGDLVRYVIHSLHRGGLALPAGLVEAPIADDVTAKARLRRLLNEVAATPRPVVLILDELDHLAPSALDAVIAPLIRWAPPNLLVVMASRQPPPLPLSTFRVQGLLAEFDADDLRFTPAEIAQLFGNDLSRHELAAITAHTDGWPVALQLLRGWWDQERDKSLLLERFGSLTEEIAAYLSEQVFGALPPDLHRFLIESSVLDRLSPGAVERVFAPLMPDGNGGDAGRLWRSLVTSPILKPFLKTVDEDVDAYSLHPILREVLADAFAALPAARRREIHRAAAVWCGQAGYLTRALRHAAAAEDDALAGSLVEAAGTVQIWTRQGLLRARTIDSMVSDRVLAAFPRLRLLRALILAKTGEIARAREMLELVRRDTEGFTRDRPGGDADALALDALVVESTITINECSPVSDAYLAHYLRTVRKVSGDDHIFQAYVKNTYSIACHQRGLFAKAIAAGREAIDHYRQADLPHGEFFCHLHIGVAHFAEGRADEAEACYKRAQSIARRHFPDDPTKGLCTAALNLELAYERNQMNLVERRIADVADQLRHSEAWFDMLAAIFGPASMTALARDGLAAALRWLDRGEEIMIARNLHGMRPFLAASRISCLAMAGEGDAAAKLAQEFGLGPATLGRDPGVTLWREDEAVAAALLRLALANGDGDAVLSALPPFLARAEQGGRHRTALRLHALAALAAAEAGRMEDACRHLARALALRAESGYGRVFHEHGRAFRKLIARLPGDALEDLARGQAAALAAELADGKAAPRAGGTDASPTLTPREREVLQALSLGNSDKMIARLLNLTENTVKYHLKNVYAKLQASSRTEAVHIARQRRLL